MLITSLITKGFFLRRVVFSLFFVMNLVLWGESSSGAVPFSTLIALLALWFGVSVPLTFVGAYFGFRKRVSGYIIRIFVLCFVNNALNFPLYIAVIGASSAYQSNSTSNTRSVNLHATYSRHCYGRRSAVRLHLHTAVLYTKFAVVKSDVLHVWISLSRISHTYHHLLGDNNLALLFPSMRGRLSLVVAIVFDLGLHSRLFVHILLPLLCHKTLD